MTCEIHSDAEKEYLLKAIDGFGDRMIVVSPDFEIVAANCTVKNIFGFNIVGRHCHEIFYNRHTRCEECAVQQCKETGLPTLRPSPDGIMQKGKLPCYYAYPIYKDDKIDAFVSVDFNIPMDGELEDELQRSNAFLRNLILNAVDCVIAADKKGKILIFNEMASKVFGYVAQEALTSMDIRDIYPHGLAYEVMKQLRSDEYGGPGKLRQYKVDVIARNGEKVPISLNAAIIYEKGEETATIGFFHDLRDEIRMKKQLENTQLQLLQAEKMSSLGKLAAGVAHQLNNPLGGITLFTKLIMEEYELEENLKDDLDRILKDAERCRETVKELLEFTRQTRYLMRPSDINKAISRTLFLLENQSLFHNIEIRKKLSTLPPVMADVQQLNHVFMNLILNSVQAMEGKGKLTVENGMKLGSDQIIIKISDTGPGIPEEILPQVFDPFFTTKEEGEGTGLGLSLVYGIINNHGGTVKALNNSDGGATFIIEMPVRKEADAKGGHNGE